CHTEEALFAGFEPDGTVHGALLRPLVVERRHMRLEKLAVRLPEQVVLGFEQCALHTYLLVNTPTGPHRPVAVIHRTRSANGCLLHAWNSLVFLLRIRSPLRRTIHPRRVRRSDREQLAQPPGERAAAVTVAFTEQEGQFLAYGLLHHERQLLGGLVEIVRLPPRLRIDRGTDREIEAFGARNGGGPQPAHERRGEFA